MLKQQFMLIIAGPTGVGKSDFAENIARLLPAELVNADMGQLYTPLTIGTAKPDWRTSTIPHHLFDVINEPRDYTVIEYRKNLKAVLADIWQRNKVPIVVGGSSFYLNSLFYPPKTQPKKTLPEIEEIADDVLWQHLYEIDPVRARSIERNDTYRIKRALEIWYSTGIKPSDYQPIYNPLSDYHLIYLTRNRDELIGRINKRVAHMIRQGWMDEVAPLKSTEWEQFLLRKKLIGYDDILQFFDIKEPTAKDMELLLHTIAKRTRRYAKRQMTYWRMLQVRLKKQLAHQQKDAILIPSQVETINMSQQDMDAYAHRVADQLRILIA